MPGGWGSDDDAPDPELVAANGRRQARVVLRLIQAASRSEKRFTLTPSLIRGLHRIAMEKILSSAGEYRPDGEVVIGAHVPPPFDEVPGHVETLCREVEGTWDRDDRVGVAAFVLWRLCWIHPFVDGNGRTARAVSYLVLCTRFGFPLPGRHPIPERILRDRKHYYDALTKADLAWKRGVVDIRDLASVLRQALRAQVTDKPLDGH